MMCKSTSANTGRLQFWMNMINQVNQKECVVVEKTHDSAVLRTMLNRLKKYGDDFVGSIFNADKGYDGERNFESLFGMYVLPNI